MLQLLKKSEQEWQKMTDYQKIRQYQGINQQERQDHKLILNYQEIFTDLLTRNNQMAHFTSSAFILNRQRTKTLFIYHKIYDTWGWTGGHVDGESDFLAVALREAQEETGLKELRPLSQEIASLDIIPVFGHFKNDQWVSSHQHLSVAYLVEADEEAELILNEEETKGVAWIELADIEKYSQEPELFKIYQKLLKRSQQENFLKE